MPRKGIKDWFKKEHFLKIVYNVSSRAALVDSVTRSAIAPNKHDKKDILAQIADNMRRWDVGKPTGSNSLLFWEEILIVHAINSNFLTLFSNNIVEFILLFSNSPEQPFNNIVVNALSDPFFQFDDLTKRKLLSTEFRKNDKDGKLKPDTFKWGPFTELEGPSTGIKSGHLHSHQMYNSPETSAAWSNLIDSKSYKQYIFCYESLQTLISEPEWLRALENNIYDCVVSLAGGGAPDKDWVIIDSILPHLESILSYHILDTSPYMLRATEKKLSSSIEQKKLSKKVEILPTIRNILTLDYDRKTYSSNSSIWTLLGGTIGNLLEKEFFRSINGSAKTNDLLIVGVDTCDEEETQDFINRMKQQYSGDDVDGFMEIILDDVFNDKKQIVEFSIIDRKKGRYGNYSDIPKSKTLVLKSTVLGKETILAHSTRYQLPEFIQFAEHLGWRFLLKVDCEGSHFKQLLFKRK